jgi:hypothetical protein
MATQQEIALAMKQERDYINKQKEGFIDTILKKEIEAGELKVNVFDRSRELWKHDVKNLLELASVVKDEKDIPTTKGKVEGKKELSLANKLEKGEVDSDTALGILIEKHPFFKV